MRCLLYCSGRCCVFSVHVGTWECADPSCEESRQCWQSCSWCTASCWEVPGGIAQAPSVTMNGVATALFHPYIVRFLACCSKNASKLSGTFLKSFLRENILCGWKALLLLNITLFFLVLFCFFNNKLSFATCTVWMASFCCVYISLQKSAVTSLSVRTSELRDGNFCTPQAPNTGVLGSGICLWKTSTISVRNNPLFCLVAC